MSDPLEHRRAEGRQRAGAVNGDVAVLQIRELGQSAYFGIVQADRPHVPSAPAKLAHLAINECLAALGKRTGDVSDWGGHRRFYFVAVATPLPLYSISVLRLPLARDEKYFSMPRSCGNFPRTT